MVEGRFRVTELLGKGGMGSAWLALDEKVGAARGERKVVVKVPRLSSLEDEGFQERFEREVRSLIALDHPHIVKVFDFGTIDERGEAVPRMILQYLPGRSLQGVPCERRWST